MGIIKSAGWSLVESKGFGTENVSDNRVSNYKVKDVATLSEIRFVECNCIIHANGKKGQQDLATSLDAKFGGEFK